MRSSSLLTTFPHLLLLALGWQACAWGQTYTIDTIAGSGPTGVFNGGYSGDGGPATAARLNEPWGLARDSAGNLYFADQNNHRIRRISSSGIISTIAGTGTAGFAGDGGPAAAAQLRLPGAVVIDPAGNLLISDTGNNRIRRISTSGVITTVAGGGASSADGVAATSASVPQPEGIAVDQFGILYIAVRGDSRVRRVASGIITTVAGTGVMGFSGDGGQATAARIAAPYGVAVTENEFTGSFLYLSDTLNHRIRRVNLSNGVIGTIMGDGTCGSSGDNGPAILARICNPGLLFEEGGFLYLGSTDERLRRISPEGIVSSLAGVTGQEGFSGDGGPSTAAQISLPYGFAIAPGGVLYFNDRRNHRIRRLTPVGAPANLVTNGSFELGDFSGAFPNYKPLPLGSNALTGWTILGTQVDWHNSADFRFPYDGDKAVDLNGGQSDLSGIVQQISTIAGQQYRVSFYLAAPGLQLGFINPRGVQVTAGSYSRQIQFGATDHLAMKWFNYTFTFTATGSQTTISFTSLPGLGFWGPVLDDVRVVPLSSTPPTISNNHILPNATAGAPYSITLSRTGGTGPFNWFGLGLPRGLSLSGAGIVSGTPQGAGAENFRAFVRDALGREDSREFSLTVLPNLSGSPSSPGTGPSYRIDTVAGLYPLGDGGPAISAAPFVTGDDLAFDSSGNLFVSEGFYDRIRKVTPGGVISTVAGGAVAGIAGEGIPARSARLNWPAGLAPDNAGGLYFVASNEHRVRRVDAAGNVFTVAGTGDAGFSGDGGPATAAKLSFPRDLWLDPVGNLYVTDRDNRRVRRISPTGIITTVAGNGMAGDSGDGGPATNASLNQPEGITGDTAGNIYVSDRPSHRVRRITPLGVISTYAGIGGAGGFAGDGGLATSARLFSPGKIHWDNTGGNLYIADTENVRVRKVNSSGIISTAAGTGLPGLGGDGGPAISAQLSPDISVAVSPAGELHVMDGSFRVRRVDSAGNINAVAGAVKFVGEGGPGLTAKLHEPLNIAYSNGDLYISELRSCLLRRLRGGLINIVGGNGVCYGDVPGPATASGIFFPGSIAISNTGILYFVRFPDTIRQITAAGLASDLISGLAVTAITTDSAGNVVAALGNEHRVVRITPAGVVTLIAGTGVSGYSGDGGLAISAQLDYPNDVVYDRAGNLYVSDARNNRVRRISGGVITTVAGNGTPGYSGDGGPAVAAQVTPQAIEVDASGSLFIADAANRVVRTVSPSGIIQTIAGNTMRGYVGDNGPALDATIHHPSDLAVGDGGVIYVTDSQNDGAYHNDLVRRLTPCSMQTATPSVTIGSSGGDGSFNLASTPAGCAATVLSGASWITVTSATTGVTPLNVNYRIAPLTTSASRTGTITVNGLTVTVTQNPSSGGGTSPPPPPPAVIVPAPGTPPSIMLSSSGGVASASLAFESATGPTRWTSSVSAAWIRVSPSEGITPSQISITADASRLTPGIHSGSVTIRPEGGTAWSIPVVITVNAPSTVMVPPGDLVLVRATGFTAFQTSIPMLSSIPGAEFQAEISGGGGLRVSPSSGKMPALLTVSSAPGLSPGEYTGVLRVRQLGSAAEPRQIPVRFVVPAAGPAEIAVRSSARTFAVNVGAPSALRQIVVENVGAGSVGFTTSVTQSGARPWLRVQPAAGVTSAEGAASIELRVDLRGFTSGTYKETVRVVSNLGRVIEVPIAVALNPRERALAVAPSGLYFEAVQGGPPPPPKPFHVINDGVQDLTFQAAVNPSYGNGSWLRIGRAAGSSSAGAPATPVQVSADPTGLGEGTYYGLIEVTAPSADNSPQYVVAVLNVRAPAVGLLPFASPDGLLFVANEGSANPAAQAITVSNPSARSTTASLALFTDTERPWLAIDQSGFKLEPGRSATVLVRPLLASFGGGQPLTRGVYRAQLAVGFAEEGLLQVVDMTLVVAPPATAAPQATAKVPISLPAPRAETAPCVANRLVATFSQTGAGFRVTAGWPNTVEVQAVDDCGRPLTNGSAVVSFSNGDPLLTLRPLSDGRWTASWSPQRALDRVTLTARLRTGTEPAVEGTVQVTGNVAPALAPLIAPGGIVNGATGQADAPLAPGALAKVIGERLAVTSTQAAVPWPLELGGTRVLVGPRIMRLEAVGDRELKGVIPASLTPNTSFSVVVSRGSQLSLPETVTLAEAQPSVFTPDGTGKGQGSIFVARADGRQELADAANPASPGETVVIYCSGLGAVTPNVADGTAAPASPPAVVAGEVTVTVAGVPAQVQFAGLTPGQSGLYQINAVVPAGVSVGEDPRVPVIVTVAGQSSAPVTMGLRIR